eukprot:1683852-Amphidinium_carterae.1
MSASYPTVPWPYCASKQHGKYGKARYVDERSGCLPYHRKEDWPTLLAWRRGLQEEIPQKAIRTKEKM